MNLVLDTNILVSALWTPSGKTADLLNSILSGQHTICHDCRIIREYYDVLRRPKFHFKEWQISSLMDAIINDGISVVPTPLPSIPFTDQSDRKFFETAKFCNALLVTGNTRHYPDDPCVTTVAGIYRALYS